MSRHVRRRSREGFSHGPTVGARVQSAEEAIINLVGALDLPEAQLKGLQASTEAARKDLDRFRVEMQALIREKFECLHLQVERQDAAERSTCFKLMDNMQNDQKAGQDMLRRVQKLDAGVQALAEELGVVEDIDQEDY